MLCESPCHVKAVNGVAWFGPNEPTENAPVILVDEPPNENPVKVEMGLVKGASKRASAVHFQWRQHTRRTHRLAVAVVAVALAAWTVALEHAASSLAVYLDLSINLLALRRLVPFQGLSLLQQDWRRKVSPYDFVNRSSPTRSRRKILLASWWVYSNLRAATTSVEIAMLGSSW